MHHNHRVGEFLMEGAIRLCGISAILFVLGIFVFVFREGAGVLLATRFDWLTFAVGREWAPAATAGPEYGSLPLLTGTLCVSGIAMLIAVPLGVGGALYVSEFCSPAWRETLKIVIELLAAIPSIVWGFVGLMVMNPLIMRLTGAPLGLNVLNGGVILALMSVPIITSIGEDALKAVPDSYREAGLAAGANRWQLIRYVLLPAARPGLLAAVLLGTGRAIGETMAVLLATGHSVRFPASVLDPVRTLTATVASELGEAAVGSEHYQVLFLIGAELFVLSLVVNLAADVFVRGIRRRA